MPASMKRRQFLFGIGSLALLTPSVAFPAVKPSDKAVLLVVDVQNCFLPGGTLAVNGGNEIIPIINALAQKFKNVIFLARHFLAEVFDGSSRKTKQE